MDRVHNLNQRSSSSPPLPARPQCAALGWPITSSGQIQPQEDGLGLAERMAQQTGPDSIDDSRHKVLLHSKWGGTNKKKTEATNAADTANAQA